MSSKSTAKRPNKNPARAKYNLLNQCARNKVRRYERMLKEQPTNAQIPPVLLKARAEAQYPYRGKAAAAQLPATPKTAKGKAKAKP